jgi:hypothetical protein
MTLGDAPDLSLSLGIPSLPPATATPAASLLSMDLPASAAGMGSLMALLRDSDPPAMAPPSLPTVTAPAPIPAGMVSPCVELLIRRVEDQRTELDWM